MVQVVSGDRIGKDGRLSVGCSADEETGSRVKVAKLLSDYVSTHRLLVYLDGKKWQPVSLHFEAEIIDGELTVNEDAAGLSFLLILKRTS